jgi:signal transduction histidine kinase
MSVLAPQPLAIELAVDADSGNQRMSPNLDAADLHDLLRLVNETSQQLQATHIRLQDEVARLQRELAEANAALRRSQALAALGEMAAGIAHEVRNPLGSIQLYVQMLAEDLNDRPAQAALCAKISRSVTGLDAIVRDVLSFSRDMTIRPQLVRAADLIERALDA